MENRCKIPRKECAEFVDSLLSSGEPVSTQKMYDLLENEYNWIEKNYPNVKNNPDNVEEYREWTYTCCRAYTESLKSAIYFLKGQLRQRGQTKILNIDISSSNKKQFIYKYTKVGYVVFDGKPMPEIDHKTRMECIISKLKENAIAEITKIQSGDSEKPKSAKDKSASIEDIDELIKKLNELKQIKFEKELFTQLQYISDLCEQKPNGWIPECLNIFEATKSDLKGKTSPFTYGYFLMHYANKLDIYDLPGAAEQLYIEAISVFEDYLNENKDIHYLNMLSYIKNDLATHYLCRFNYNKSIQLAKQAIDLILINQESINSNIALVVELHLTLSEAYANINDVDSAEKHGVLAQDFLKSHKSDTLSPKLQVRVLNHLSILYAEYLDRYLDGYHCAEDALECARGIHDIDKLELSNTILRRCLMFNPTLSDSWNVFKDLHKEAIVICRDLVSIDKEAYILPLAEALGAYLRHLLRIADMCDDVREEANHIAEEALAIYEDLSYKDPSLYAYNYAYLLKICASLQVKALETKVVAWSNQGVDFTDEDMDKIDGVYEFAYSSLADAKNLIESINTDHALDEQLEDINNELHYLPFDREALYEIIYED